MSCLKISTAVFTVLFSLYRFSLGVTEAVFLSKYSEYQTECRLVWIQVLIACVLNFIVSVFTCCGALTLYQLFNESDKNENDNNRGSSLQFIPLAIGIWIQVTYFNISDSCQAFYQSQANELWTLFMIEMGNFWGSIGFLGLAILISCFACCFVIGSEANKEQKSPQLNSIRIDGAKLNM